MIPKGGIGPVTVKVPKVRAKDGKPVTFRSALVPPYVRKSRSIEAALPWLYLKGISTGEMGAALKMLLGPDATGFSAKTVSFRLVRTARPSHRLPSGKRGGTGAVGLQTRPA